MKNDKNSSNSSALNIISNFNEKDTVDQKTQDLILMTSGKGPRRWRQRKSEYLKKLESDNSQLKNLIIEIQQQISALQAQNDILKDQLSYFQGCLTQAAPMVFQSNSENK